MDYLQCNIGVCVWGGVHPTDSRHTAQFNKHHPLGRSSHSIRFAKQDGTKRQPKHLKEKYGTIDR